MKSMLPSFLWLIFTGTGGDGSLVPRIRYWNTPASKTNQQNLSCEINNEIQVWKFYLILLLKKDSLRSHVTITKDPLYPNTYLYRAPFCKGPGPHSDRDIWWTRLETIYTWGPQCQGHQLVLTSGGCLLKRVRGTHPTGILSCLIMLSSSSCSWRRWLLFGKSDLERVNPAGHVGRQWTGLHLLLQGGRHEQPGNLLGQLHTNCHCAA